MIPTVVDLLAVPLLRQVGFDARQSALIIAADASTGVDLTLAISMSRAAQAFQGASVVIPHVVDLPAVPLLRQN